MGERTIDPPFSVLGEFILQNGPSRAAAVSVAPAFPLLSRQTSVEKLDRIREENTFVVTIVGRLADAIEKVDADIVFGFGQPNLAGEFMHMTHKRRGDFAQTRIGSLRHCPPSTTGVTSCSGVDNASQAA